MPSRRFAFLPSPRALTAAAAAGVLALSLTACTTAPSTEGAQRIDAPATAEAPTPEPSEGAEDVAADEGMAAAFAERDRFLADQQQPLDGSPLVAKTPAQIELVTAQREYVESQGATWDANAESITLALPLDACETSILNGHAIDVETFRAHVNSSPLIDAVSGGDPQAIEGAVSMMVFGTRFICPDDAAQWESAWSETDGVY
ncbi:MULTISPECIES: hypothetical protein [Microbacterium]|uniref:hypothetical protein n=1 Tax=Microbacterium TaxID=33882 RepID=UPI00214AFEAF|nr:MULTISPECIES: hypothetical protein [unclassified Microbacterium]MCR2811866.1 hypothetical protein [Microbacterium sp. zg.Y1084]MDL5486508.1 hypothetical protein [Microbacterium sp. zg-Y1211]